MRKKRNDFDAVGAERMTDTELSTPPLIATRTLSAIAVLTIRSRLLTYERSWIYTLSFIVVRNSGFHFVYCDFYRFICIL